MTTRRIMSCGHVARFQSYKFKLPPAEQPRRGWCGRCKAEREVIAPLPPRQIATEPEPETAA